NDVVDALLNSTEFDVPASLVDQEIDRVRKDAVQRFGGEMDFQQLPKEIFEEQATRRVKTGLLFQEVVKKNELTADAEKVEEKIQEIASTYEQPEEVIAHFNSSPEQKSQIESTVLEDAVVEYVLGRAQITEKAMKYEEAIQAGQTQR
ncbi:trigger factor, partial [Marinobacter sp. ELB17]